ncbi:CinA family protein [Kallotenue papyrolyticum]|uniref:CinA family protein n=1 Tax=Kallotenue papyrolyticum TaxID=1325125 RepID=UPI0004785904|nr:CinA family protein [Kallotenue papyrolyticum]
MQQHLELARDIGARLVARGWTLASAESCTGGLIGHLITEIAGSSRYYLGGIIAYSNAVKQALLGVPATILLDHGAVSEATARAMAAGVRHALQADVGLATTGIAGPGGATPTKPVGLVYVAVATPLGQDCLRFVFSGDRQAIKQQSAAAALRLLLDSLQ